MKKLIVLFICSLGLLSCSMEEDNGPTYGYQLAVVDSLALPDYFEIGKTYEIEVSYTLPSACHSPNYVEATRGGNEGEEYRDIYVGAVTTYEMGMSECSEDSTDLEQTDSFNLYIDEDEDYTFYLWQGRDSTGQSQFETVTVPVGAPEQSNE